MFLCIKCVCRMCVCALNVCNMLRVCMHIQEGLHAGKRGKYGVLAGSGQVSICF